MMDEENKGTEEDLKKIQAHFKEENTKRIQLEIELNYALEELNISNTEYLLAIKKIEEYKDSFKKAYHRAEFYKDLFSHDIVNILQAILTGMEICEAEVDDSSEIQKDIKIVISQVLRGAKLVLNIRKLSQLEEIEISLKRTEIYNILLNTIDFVKNSYKEKKINIKVDSFSTQIYVQVNELIRDVFENILYNAIKHNKSAIPEIEIKISKEQKLGENYVKMEFQDNGGGISDHRKEKIFKRGYGQTKSVHGMGLGLSLVKTIIEKCQGKIWVEDRVNGDYSKGSNFVLLIPEIC